MRVHSLSQSLTHFHYMLLNIQRIIFSCQQCSSSNGFTRLVFSKISLRSITYSFCFSYTVIWKSFSSESECQQFHAHLILVLKNEENNSKVTRQIFCNWCFLFITVVQRLLASTFSAGVKHSHEFKHLNYSKTSLMHEKLHLTWVITD